MPKEQDCARGRNGIAESGSWLLAWTEYRASKTECQQKNVDYFRAPCYHLDMAETKREYVNYEINIAIESPLHHKLKLAADRRGMKLKALVKMALTAGLRAIAQGEKAC